MNIAILGTRGIPNNYGGFEQFAEYLSIELVNNSHKVTVYCPHFHNYDKQEFKGVKLKKIYSAENIIGASANFFYDYKCLKDALKDKFDIILECGYGSASFSYYLLNIKKSIIITNMDGIEWQRSKWSGLTKRILKLAEKFAVKKSNVIVSDNIKIKKYYKKKYGIESEYIPYGANVFKNPDKNILNKFSLKENEYFLNISRMEPENNIETILDGYVNSKSQIKFVIISNKDSKYAKYIINKYKNYENILLLGNNYNQNELSNIRYFSKAYFHGHSVGGTNPSLLEAMASQSLIIAHNNVYNYSILERDTLYFNNSDDISSIIRNIDYILIRKEYHVNNNIQKIKTIYNWENVVNKYVDLFQQLLKSGK